MGSLSGSLLISSAIDPQVYELALPGASDEPGHRAISEQIQTHLLQPADSENGIATIFYNFRGDYGSDPAGNKLSNLITAEQKTRAREAFELWGQAIGVQFVETVSQGIVVATGDLRALSPGVITGRGAPLALSGLNPVTGQPTVILDNAENWYVAFGASDDPLRPDSWFEIAMREIGRTLGLGIRAICRPARSWAAIRRWLTAIPTCRKRSTPGIRTSSTAAICTGTKARTSTCTASRSRRAACCPRRSWRSD